MRDRVFMKLEITYFSKNLKPPKNSSKFHAEGPQMIGDSEQNLFARDLCFSVKRYKYLNFTSCKVVSAYPIGKFGFEQCFYLLYPNVRRTDPLIDGDASN
jgi:hypothetical protein